MAPIMPVVALVQQAVEMATGKVGDANVATRANPFAGFLEQATDQMTKLRSDANEKVRGLMTGDGTDIHTVLIATQKADLAFELALSVRNKAVGAYQQLMGMQF